MKKRCTNSNCRKYFNISALYDSRCPHCGKYYSGIVIPAAGAGKFSAPKAPISAAHKFSSNTACGRNTLYKAERFPDHSICKAFIGRTRRVLDSLKNMTIGDLDFSVRAYNGLTRAGINTLYDLVMLSPDELLSTRNLGEKGCGEVYQKLRDNKLALLGK